VLSDFDENQNLQSWLVWTLEDSGWTLKRSLFVGGNETLAIKKVKVVGSDRVAFCNRRKGMTSFIFYSCW
jgi:hypothetical protein